MASPISSESPCANNQLALLADATGDDVNNMASASASQWLGDEPKSEDSEDSEVPMSLNSPVQVANDESGWYAVIADYEQACELLRVPPFHEAFNQVVYPGYNNEMGPDIDISRPRQHVYQGVPFESSWIPRTPLQIPSAPRSNAFEFVGVQVDEGFYHEHWEAALEKFRGPANKEDTLKLYNEIKRRIKPGTHKDHSATPWIATMRTEYVISHDRYVYYVCTCMILCDSRNLIPLAEAWLRVMYIYTYILIYVYV